MKDVILTFFGIVLLYSLLFNEKETVAPSSEINYSLETPAPSFFVQPDSSVFYFHTENNMNNLSDNYLFFKSL